MYQLYQRGYSCEQVSKAFGISRQSVHLRFTRQKLQLRPRIIPLPYILYRGKKYTRRKNDYYACTSGTRQFLHRQVWIDSRGLIPQNYDVHHKDNDKSNNHINNLELISKSKHAIKYPGRQNQYTKR
jgi:hypothetical protein